AERPPEQAQSTVARRNVLPVNGLCGTCTPYFALCARRGLGDVECGNRHGRAISVQSVSCTSCIITNLKEHCYAWQLGVAFEFGREMGSGPSAWPAAYVLDAVAQISAPRRR